MNPIRYEYFCSLTNEEKMQLTYKVFIKSELLEIINELLVNEEIRQEAILIFVECLPLEKVAEKSYRDLKTIKRHKRRLSYALKRTLCKLCPYKATKLAP